MEIVLNDLEVGYIHYSFRVQLMGTLLILIVFDALIINSLLQGEYFLDRQ
jgi:hypothetical protein